MDESRIDTTRVQDDEKFLEDQQVQETEPHSSIPQISHTHMMKEENKQISDDSIPNNNVIKSPQQSEQLQASTKEKIFNELGMQRKQDGYAQLQIQEETIKKAAATHFNICDTLFTQINKRTQVSEQSMNTILQFFKEKCQQEEQNLRILQVKSPAYLGIFKSQDHDKQNQAYYPQLTTVLETFYVMTQKQAQNLQILVNNIEKLIKNKLQDNITQYSKCVKGLNQSEQQLEFRNSQLSIKKNAVEQQLLTLKNSQKICKVFNEMKSNGGTHQKRFKDLFYLEKKLKSSYLEQLKNQQMYGEMIYNFWNEILKQESLRLEIIQNGLQTYIENQQEAYNGSKGGAQIQIMIKNIQDIQTVKQCEHAFTTTEILLPCHFQEISSALSLAPGLQLQVKEVQRFLVSYPISIIKQTSNLNHPLVLKFFNKIQRDNGTLLSSWKKIVIIVSLDKNILIYDSEDGLVPHAKAQNKFAIEYCELVQTKKNPLTAELRHTIPGMIFDSHQKILIKFDSQDEFEELQFYISSNRMEIQKKQNK